VPDRVEAGGLVHTDDATWIVPAAPSVAIRLSFDAKAAQFLLNFVLRWNHLQESML